MVHYIILLKCNFKKRQNKTGDEATPGPGEYTGNCEDSWVLDTVGVTCNGATECTWLVEDVEFTLSC